MSFWLKPLTAAVLALGAATAAQAMTPAERQAQRVDNRQARQAERIDQGVASGQLTRREERRLFYVAVTRAKDELYLLYPPHKRTEEATLREAEACRREGITINLFLLSGWSQSREDIQFAYRLAEAAKGRVFFTAGRELDRYVVWDYVQRKRMIVG